MKKPDQFLTTREATKILKVNVMTIYRYIKAKRLKAYKIGKEFRIERSELINFLKKVRTN